MNAQLTEVAVTQNKLTTEQSTQLANLKRYYPYRIVWGAISPDGTDFYTGADYDKRKCNAKARKGWTVYIYGA